MKTNQTGSWAQIPDCPLVVDALYTAHINADPLHEANKKYCRFCVEEGR